MRNTEADGVFLGLLLDNKHRFDTFIGILLLGLFLHFVHIFVFAFRISSNPPRRYDIVKSHLDGFYTYFASTGFSHGSTWKHWNDLSRCRRLIERLMRWPMTELMLRLMWMLM